MLNTSHPLRHLFLPYVYFFIAFAIAAVVPYNEEALVFVASIPIIALTWLGARSGRIGLKKYRREMAVNKAWKAHLKGG